MGRFHLGSDHTANLPAPKRAFAAQKPAMPLGGGLGFASAGVSSLTNFSNFGDYPLVGPNWLCYIAFISANAHFVPA